MTREAAGGGGRPWSYHNSGQQSENVTADTETGEWQHWALSDGGGTMVTDSRSQEPGGVSTVPGLGSGKIRSCRYIRWVTVSYSSSLLTHNVRAVISILVQAQLPATDNTG